MKHYNIKRMDASEEKSPLTEKLVTLWLKHDPFVRFVAKDNEEIRRDTMLALLGEKAAARYMKGKSLPPRILIVTPKHIRDQEQEFLEHPPKRSEIIHQLVHWGSDERINQENPESYNTRVQIIHSLMGPLFMNANENQEKLIVEGLKVLAVTKTTNMGKQGELSPLVHQEILSKVADILRYHHVILENRAQKQAEMAMRAHLLKTIQGLKAKKHHGYYTADDAAARQKIIASKFPLKEDTYQGLKNILRHYTFSAWKEFRVAAHAVLEDIGDPKPAV